MSIQRKDSLYARIFEVKVLQEYYLKRYEIPSGGSPTPDLDVDGNAQLAQQYDVQNDLTFIPTAATVQLMKDAQLVIRQTSTGFFVGSPVVDDSGWKPVRTIDPLAVLQFEIRLKNEQFMNFSDLPVIGLGEVTATVDDHTEYYRNYYYFTNRLGNYPFLNTTDPLNQTNLVAGDQQSDQVYRIHPQSIGLIEINLDLGGVDNGNVLVAGEYNITKTGSVWDWPKFELNIDSRSLIWRFINNAGVEANRSEHHIPFTKIQTNPIKLDGVTAAANKPNPSPQNVKWDASISEYVADAYLGY